MKTAMRRAVCALAAGSVVASLAVVGAGTASAAPAAMQPVSTTAAPTPPGTSILLDLLGVVVGDVGHLIGVDGSPVPPAG